MADALAIFSALVAAAGLGFSGWQLRLIHKEREQHRALGIEGVCLSWRAVESPNQSDVDAAGKAVWTYVFRVDNPGRFPISNVHARVLFPSPVARVRHGDVVDPPDKELVLEHSVLPGGANFEWAQRRLQMSYDGALNRPGIRAEVSFRDAEGNSHTTHWPMNQQTSRS